MTRAEFLNTIDELYKAVRKYKGYGADADKLIDNLEEMADAYESKVKE